MIRNRPVWLFYIIYEIIIKNFEAKVKTKSVAMVKKITMLIRNKNFVAKVVKIQRYEALRL